MNNGLKAYIQNNVEDFEERSGYAFYVIDRERRPLCNADYQLYKDMYDCAEEYCEINGLDIDDFDMEDYL